MKIILDAMGGDHAPRAIVQGALMAQKELGVEVLLAGRVEDILEILKQEGINELPKGFEIAHAPDVIAMEENPTASIKEKPESSIMVALRALADGQGEALVSAGSTGALLTAATFVVKRIKGVRRAALSPLVPTAQGPALLIDCGANTECTAEYLLQFGFMGAYYMQRVQNIQNPRVGLLNIGTEETKGPPSHKEAYQLLAQAHTQGALNFVGNLEGRDIAFGGADVIVADGFSGNIFLKTLEGVGLYFADTLKGILMKNVKSKLAAALIRRDMTGFKKMLDYTEYGGAPLLGLQKPVIKAHGASNPRAVCSAVRQAVSFAQGQVPQALAAQIDSMRAGSGEAEQ